MVIFVVLHTVAAVPVHVEIDVAIRACIDADPSPVMPDVAAMAMTADVPINSSTEVMPPPAHTGIVSAVAVAILRK